MGKFRTLFKRVECLRGKMKRENCPFCGHRWIRKSHESPIICPNCNRKYYSREDLEQRQREK